MMTTSWSRKDKKYVLEADCTDVQWTPQNEKNPSKLLEGAVSKIVLFLICQDLKIPLELAPFPHGMVAATS
jgi:hypothetical protein